MIQNLNEQLKEYGRKHRFHGRWMKVLVAMACVVVFCTTYALILPAITLDNTVVCGMSEHTHGETCYEQVLSCTDENEEHVHTEDCYERVLTCSVPEHTHTENCYKQETEAGTEAGIEPVAEGQTETGTGSAAEGQAEAGTEAGTGPVAEGQAEAGTGPVTESQAEAGTETEMESVTESRTETETEPAAESRTEAETGGSAEAGTEQNPQTLMEEEPASPVLTEQTVDAVVYSDAEYSTLYTEPVTITLKGLLPEGVVAKAYPVSVELNDASAAVVEAYDIGLFVTSADGEEKEYEPDSKVEVKIISEKLKEVESVNIYHIDDADDANPNPQPELVTNGIEVGEDNEVKFDADKFSVYVLTDAGSDEGIATMAEVNGNVITMTVGETYTLSTTYRNYNGNSSDISVATVSINNGRVTITAIKAGTATITLTSMGTSYTYTVTVNAAHGPYTVTYDVNSDRETLGYYGADSQSWYGDVLVADLSGFSESVGSENDKSVVYIVKNVSSQTRIARAGNKGYVMFTYTFLYWEDSSGNKYYPGDTIDLTSNLTLTAKWCAHFDDVNDGDNYDINTVAFYINIVGNIGEFDPTNVNNYTDCLYTTKVLGNDADNFADKYNSVDFYGNSNGSDYVATDAGIRSGWSTGITGKVSGYGTLTLASFPSDDEIFNMIRTWGDRYTTGNTSITVDGSTYKASEITADNFDIYWCVIKPNNTDGWHIDGLLVPKEAKLTVTKTFVGNKEAIAAVQNEYSITVSGSSTSYTLSLGENGSSGNVTLYHDANSSTYTWVLTGLKQLTQYTVTENDYTASSYNVAASYQITNSRTSSENTNGWQTYNSSNGVTVTQCYGYQDNVDYTGYQTVALRNVYTKPYVMTILKQDGTTYNGLNNVPFTLTVEDSSENVKVDNLTVTTNSDGQIEVNFQELGTGTYTFTLTEQAYEGYQALATITGTATVDPDGNVKVTNITAEVEGDNTLVSVDTVNPSIVYIQNISERTSVTVNKIWTDGTDKQVTMQLVRNGTDVTGATKELSLSKGWEYTWTDLPLYVDGKEATYTVRETWIGEPGASGSSSYTAADDTDGYKDYIVTTSRIKNEDRSTTVTVTNTKDDGQVVFTKVNEKGNALEGAKFTVYTDASCNTIATIDGSNAVFTSDSNGLVTIVGLPVGTYYVKETYAPEGYAVSDTVYTLTARDYNSTLTLNGKTVSTVVNEKSRTKFTLKKVDATTTSATLNGAVFTLTNSDGKYYAGINSDDYASWQTEKNEITVSDGTYTFSGLENGTYLLTEIKAPDGYNLLTDKITITINSSGVAAAYGTGSSNIAEVTAENGAFTITVKNSTGTALPNTGGMGTTMYTLSGLILMAIAMSGCLMYSGRKRRKGGVR